IPLYTSHNNFANLFYKEGYLNIKLSCFQDEYLVSPSYTKHKITNVFPFHFINSISPIYLINLLCPPN
ncbi:MAG TPA: hypothetical protein VF222_14395, partial [Nitrososphaeraceae archaeon]